MLNPEVSTSNPRGCFHVYYASDENDWREIGTVYQWCKEFKDALKAWVRGNFEYRTLDIASPVGAPLQAHQDAGPDQQSKAGLRAKPDDVLVLYTPAFKDVPCPELEMLVDSLKHQVGEADVWPHMWVLKFDPAPFDNTHVGKLPLWHELRPSNPPAERFHFPREKNVDLIGEMAHAARLIVAHQTCTHELPVCPGYAARKAVATGERRSWLSNLLGPFSRRQR